MSMDLDLRAILSVIRKRLWLIVLIVFVCCTATGIYSYAVMKPVYEASTKLIVNSSADQSGLTKLDMNAINTNISLINTYKEIIKTPAIMDIVAGQHPEFGLTSGQLSEKIKFSSVNETQVITLAIQDHSYEKAALIVNAVSQVFKNEIPRIMKVDNVYLLNQADPVKIPKPVKPNPKLNIALGFLASFLLSIGIVFLLEFLDDRLKTEKDVERFLSLPTLVMVAHIREHDLNQKRKSESLSRKAGEASSVSIR